MDKIKIGDKASLKKKVTEKEIVDWARLTGDFNPIHIDNEFAEKSRFGNRIAHGLYCQGMISNLIGNELPGNGAILVNEKINYNFPVYIDDEIECVCYVKEISEKKNKMVIGFVCTNQYGKNVLDGEALVVF